MWRLISAGMHHKKQRRALDAAFSVPKVKDLTHIFWGPADNMIEKWKAEVTLPNISSRCRSNQCRCLHPAKVLVSTWSIGSHVVLSTSSASLVGYLHNCRHRHLMTLSGFDYTFDSLNNSNEPMALAYRELMKGERPSFTFFAVSFLSEIIPLLKFLRESHPFMTNIKKVNSIL